MQYELGKYYNPEFEKELKAYIRARVPDKLFDTHVHLCPDGPLGHEHVDGPEGMRYWRDFMVDIFGADRVKGGLMMPHIQKAPYVEMLNDFTMSEIEKDAGGSTAAMVIRPDMDPEAVERYILAHPDITTLKPYMTYSSNPVRLHSRIEEFVPEWTWQLADKHRLSVMLHIARYLTGLADPDTLRTVIRVTTQYPNMRLILAHCALAHNPDTFKRAIPFVRRLDNLYFDTSGVTEPAAICHVLDAFGPGKLLYGSDVPFGSTMGRIVQCGNGLLGLDPMGGWLKLDFPMDYDCCLIPNTMEGMITLITAMDEYGVDRAGWEAIFYENARRVFRLAHEKDRAHRVDADEFDRKMREKDRISNVNIAKGCQIWSKDGELYYDTCTKAMAEHPLGYADTDLGYALKGMAVSDLPEIGENAEAEALVQLLKARYDWANDVVLTNGEAYTGDIDGRYAVLRNELGNGQAIGAVILEKPQRIHASAPQRTAICAALCVQRALDREAELHMRAAREAVLNVWQNAARKYRIPTKVCSEALCFEMPEAALETFRKEMKLQGFIADNHFAVTLAHTEAVIDRYAAAADIAFAKAAQA